MNPNDNKYSVLFVDDEEKALKYFTRLYSDEFEILTAPSVAAAREVLQEKADSIGVLITDQRMPEEQGVDLLKYARSEYPQIVRLLTTAYSDLSDAIEAVNAGEIMRYITKPWDIDSLRMELSNAMQFFLLRRERDHLLQEKMNVWQRMLEINRLRDLLVLSCGYTHLRNPFTAIASLLANTRFSRSSSMASLQQLDTWSLLKDEIKNVLQINQKLIQETFVEDSSDFSSHTLNQILAQANLRAGVDIQGDPETALTVNAALLSKLFASLLALVRQLASDAANMTLNVSAVDNGTRLQLVCKEADWQALTLLSCPPELFISFLICHHHGGKLSINTDAGLEFQVFLPSHPSDKPVDMPDDDLLDQIFERYSIWQ